MKKWLGIVGLGLALSFQACAPSKEMVIHHQEAVVVDSAQVDAQKFFNLLVEEKYSEVGALYTQSSLKKFRETMSFMDSIPKEMKDGFFLNFFGGKVKAEELAKLDDSQYFGKFLEAIMSRAKVSSGMSFDKIDVLGGVQEGDKIHFVTVSHLKVQGKEEKAKEVQTFVKEEKVYKAEISEDIMMMATQFQTMAQQAIQQQAMMEMQKKVAEQNAALEGQTPAEPEKVDEQAVPVPAPTEAPAAK